MTTAAAAPAFTPSRPGSASGLRVSACISAPPRPSDDADGRSPSSVRGTRRSLTMAAFWVSPPCRSASITSPSGIERAPTREAQQGGEGERTEGQRQRRRRG